MLTLRPTLRECSRVTITSLYYPKSLPRRPRVFGLRSASGTSHISTKRSPWLTLPASLLLLGITGAVAYETYQPFRYTIISGVRCSRVAKAAILSAIDYKSTFAEPYTSDEERLEAQSQCHTRSAQRVLRALLANGGIFIKLGQHMSSLLVLPKEWTSTMRPLQDQCEPTPIEDVDTLFVTDMGASISELFDEFDTKPIGVASLAQVHVARDKKTGKRVAIKLQHPHLAEFCDIDMAMVEVTLGWIKFWFPEFEFTWLAGEMKENLPKEMNFVHEANNAARAIADFSGVRTSLYIPKVLVAKPRVLVMEFIEGGRVDDLQYLATHNIDRNKVAIELARIFARMVHLNGFFHADPHAGNLLIRPAPKLSKSPSNFEIVLLDHGLYFDIDDELRVNYSRFWLSLMASSSAEIEMERRKYAQLVGNIGPDLYPVFEAALTGRANLQSEDSVDLDIDDHSWQRAGSMLDTAPQSEAEMDAIRNAVTTREGLLTDILDVLRRVPRRVLMVFKLNDLTRGLDHALNTTHSHIRIFLVTARYCARAVWVDDRRRIIDQLRENGLMSISLVWEYFACWWRYQKTYRSLGIAEVYMDTQAYIVKMHAWMWGLYLKGFRGANDAAAGLSLGI